MSISLYDSNSLDKNWNNLKEAIEFMQNKTNDEINKLKLQMEIKPIEKFETLFLEGIKISIWENSSWYSTTTKYIRIDFTDECSKFLKTQNINCDSIWKGYKLFDISEDGLKSAFEFIDKIAEYDQEKHKNNIFKNKSNNETYKALSNLLKRIGISEKYYGYRTNRSKQKEWLYYNWVSEIYSQIPKDYSENKLEELIKKHKDSIQKIYDNEIKRIRDEEKKKEKERIEKERNKKLVYLLSKYDLELNCDWYNLLGKIINKNKYLRLAYYLELNRSDWHNGCSYAEMGLRDFSIDNELDQKIYDDITYYIDNWIDCKDGRCFRDCEYNYSVLYKIVAEQEPDLFKDFQIVIENINELIF